MEYVVKNIRNSKKLDFVIDAWSLTESPIAEIIQINLKCREKIETHGNPLDVVFYVVQGEGKATVDDESLNLKAEDCIQIPKNSQRSWENIGHSTLKLLVVKLKK